MQQQFGMLCHMMSQFMNRSIAGGDGRFAGADPLLQFKPQAKKARALTDGTAHFHTLGSSLEEEPTDSESPLSPFSDGRLVAMPIGQARGMLRLDSFTVSPGGASSAMTSRPLPASMPPAPLALQLVASPAAVGVAVPVRAEAQQARDTVAEMEAQMAAAMTQSKDVRAEAAKATREATKATKAAAKAAAKLAKTAGKAKAKGKAKGKAKANTAPLATAGEVDPLANPAQLAADGGGIAIDFSLYVNEEAAAGRTLKQFQSRAYHACRLAATRVGADEPKAKAMASECYRVATEYYKTLHSTPTE